MEKLNIIIELAVKFTKKYLKEYFKLLKKPILVGLFGFSFMLLITLNPILALFGLFITIPCIFYSFWNGYFITYALNDTAYNFLKKSPNVSIEQSFATIKKDEKNFAMFVSFCALLTILAYIPSIYYLAQTNNLIDLLINPHSISANINNIIFAFLIPSILILPFYNFITQAYYFRKEKESFFKLIFNCYKNLDLTGIVILLFIATITFVLSNFIPAIYVLLFIPLNLFIYSINTFWYSTKIKKR